MKAVTGPFYENFKMAIDTVRSNKLRSSLTIVGVVAMLWVGGHILVVNLAEVGVHGPLDVLHVLVDPLHSQPVLHWLADSALSAVFGLAWGAVIVALVSVWGRLRGHDSAAH